MTTYVVTGVSKGVGYGMLNVLSRDPKNTFIGIVRDKASTIKKISEDPDVSGRSNIHLVEADLTIYDTMKSAAEETSKITGGAIDYLIANGGYVSLFDAFDPIGYLGDNKPKEFEEDIKKLFDINVVGQIHLINLFMPLVLKGKMKKVISVTSGLADLDFCNQFDVFTASGYSISKAAMNMAVAKFSAQYRQEGVLFLSVCPGFVEVGHYAHSSPEDLQKLGVLMNKYLTYKPDFSGPVTPEVSVNDMKNVWENKSIENGDNGGFFSQYGNKQWL